MTHEAAIEAAAWELIHSLPSSGFYELLHRLDVHATAERVVGTYLNAINQEEGTEA